MQGTAKTKESTIYGKYSRIASTANVATLAKRKSSPIDNCRYSWDIPTTFKFSKRGGLAMANRSGHADNQANAGRIWCGT